MQDIRKRIANLLGIDEDQVDEILDRFSTTEDFLLFLKNKHNIDPCTLGNIASAFEWNGLLPVEWVFQKDIVIVDNTGAEHGAINEVKLGDKTYIILFSVNPRLLDSFHTLMMKKRSVIRVVDEEDNAGVLTCIESIEELKEILATINVILKDISSRKIYIIVKKESLKKVLEIASTLS